jgi:hypothetical protein
MPKSSKRETHNQDKGQPWLDQLRIKANKQIHNNIYKTREQTPYQIKIHKYNETKKGNQREDVGAESSELLWCLESATIAVLDTLFCFSC